MRLGLFMGYWGSGPYAGAQDTVILAERLGFDSVWTSEAYGSDALTPLAWYGAATERVRLGTAIAQISARAPAATAMAALTLDHLCAGRFILGLGVSGPQVVEGWYGQPYDKPLARTREYIEIVRRIVAREAPVEFEGAHYAVPLRGTGGLGKPLKATVHPLRRRIPIWLAAEGPKNVALAAEIADGWLPMFYAPRKDDHLRAALAEGFARRGPEHDVTAFEVACPVHIVPGADVETCAAAVKPFVALYIGGMGARGRNFHLDAVARLGYEEVALRVQDLFLAGRRDEAAAAIPTALVEQVALVGPPAKIRDELSAWEASPVTTLLVSGSPAQLRAIAEVVLG